MVCIILFAILTLGAVNASENTTNGDLTIVEVTGDYGITPEIEEINIDSDISNSSFKKAISDNAIDKLVNEKNKLGVSNDDKIQIRFTGIRNLQLSELLINKGYDADPNGAVTKRTNILIIPYRL